MKYIASTPKAKKHPKKTSIILVMIANVFLAIRPMGTISFVGDTHDDELPELEKLNMMEEDHTEMGEGCTGPSQRRLVPGNKEECGCGRCDNFWSPILMGEDRGLEE